jgi:hypothetical protein
VVAHAKTPFLHELHDRALPQKHRKALLFGALRVLHRKKTGNYRDIPLIGSFV